MALISGLPPNAPHPLEKTGWGFQRRKEKIQPMESDHNPVTISLYEVSYGDEKAV